VSTITVIECIAAVVVVSMHFRASRMVHEREVELKKLEQAILAKSAETSPRGNLKSAY
jgi:hypothetical protein